MTTTISVRQYARVTDGRLSLMLPKEFPYEDVEVIIIPRFPADDQLTFWDEKEIEAVGKIGQCVSSFPDDDEDYTKW